MVAGLAKEVMTLDTEIDETETMIEDRFRRHRHAEIILSVPGFGATLGAEFLAATGGDMTAFDSVDRLAGVAGLAPVPHDSGRISGNFKRPRRYNRRLLRACYLAAYIATRTDRTSRAYYNRKRAEGKTPHPSRPGPGPTTSQARYAEERLSLGMAHRDSGYVAVNEIGEPSRPTR